jgi:hypothetical protein
VRSRSAGPLLRWGAEAEHNRFDDPALRASHPFMARRKEGILASISTIVVLVGQTHVHMGTLATVRPAIVPPIVPGPRRQECGAAGTVTDSNMALALTDHHRVHPQLNICRLHDGQTDLRYA